MRIGPGIGLSDRRRGGAGATGPAILYPPTTDGPPITLVSYTVSHAGGTLYLRIDTSPTTTKTTVMGGGGAFSTSIHYDDMLESFDLTSVTPGVYYLHAVYVGVPGRDDSEVVSAGPYNVGERPYPVETLAASYSGSTASVQYTGTFTPAGQGLLVLVDTRNVNSEDCPLTVTIGAAGHAEAEGTTLTQHFFGRTGRNQIAAYSITGSLPADRQIRVAHGVSISRGSCRVYDIDNFAGVGAVQATGTLSSVTTTTPTVTTTDDKSLVIAFAQTSGSVSSITAASPSTLLVAAHEGSAFGAVMIAKRQAETPASTGVAFSWTSTSNVVRASLELRSLP